MTERKAIELVGSMGEDRTGGGRARRAKPQGSASGRRKTRLLKTARTETKSARRLVRREARKR